VEGANKQAMNMKASSATARYGSSQGIGMTLKISDISAVSGLVDLAGSLEQTTDAQTADGYERDVAIGGRRVHEKFQSAGRRGELQVIIAKRFSVELEGRGLEMPALEQALNQVDLARLDAMREQGAQN
jgi:hypothetical protein